MNEIESYVAAVIGTLTGMTISEEDWNKLTDPELERTTRIFFKTPSGKRVEYIRADVLDKIRSEILHLHDWAFDREEILRIIDKHKEVIQNE